MVIMQNVVLLGVVLLNVVAPIIYLSIDFNAQKLVRLNFERNEKKVLLKRVKLLLLEK